MRAISGQWKVCVAVWLLAFSAVSALADADRSAEVKQFSESLQSMNISVRIEALKKITNSGLTDRGLFDSIEKKVLEGYGVDPEDALRVDEISWMCKALASSGVADYQKTLILVADRASSRKIRGYAAESLERVAGYAQRNALMAKQTEETRGLSTESARLVNMLRSGNLGYEKDAAKTITRSTIREEKVFEVVNEVLLLGLRENSLDSEHVDTMSWLCKALGASGLPRFRGTLELVSVEGADEKLRKYAKQSLGALR